MQSSADDLTIEPDQGGIFYSNDELDALSVTLRACEKHEADLIAYEEAYNDCLNTPRAAEAWWQDPVVVIGGISIGFSLGVILTLIVK